MTVDNYIFIFVVVAGICVYLIFRKKKSSSLIDQYFKAIESQAEAGQQLYTSQVLMADMKPLPSGILTARIASSVPIGAAYLSAGAAGVLPAFVIARIGVDERQCARNMCSHVIRSLPQPLSFNEIEEVEEILAAHLKDLS